MNKFRERRVISKQREYAQLANQEKRKRRRRKNYLLHYILVFILITVIGITLSLTVFFNINKIVVKGDSKLATNDQIIEFTQVSVGQNLFRISLDKIENRVLEKTPDIDSVNVKRGLPDKLIVQLQTSEPKMAYYKAGQYYLISNANRVINIVDNLEQYPNIIKCASEDLGEIKLGDYLTNNEKYKSIDKVISYINASGIEGIKAMEIKGTHDIKLNYQDRITIQIGNMTEIDYKLKMVKKVLSEHIKPDDYGVIDAKVQTVAYFRPMSLERQKSSGKFVKIEE